MGANLKCPYNRKLFCYRKIVDCRGCRHFKSKPLDEYVVKMT